MRQKSGTGKAPAGQVIKDIRRAARKQCLAGDWINVLGPRTSIQQKPLQQGS